MKTYHIISALGRDNICRADADALTNKINALTASNGDSRYIDRVRQELNSAVDGETQALYGLEIVEDEG